MRWASALRRAITPRKAAAAIADAQRGAQRRGHGPVLLADALRRTGRVDRDLCDGGVAGKPLDHLAGHRSGSGQIAGFRGRAQQALLGNGEDQVRTLPVGGGQRSGLQVPVRQLAQRVRASLTGAPLVVR